MKGSVISIDEACDQVFPILNANPLLSLGGLLDALGMNSNKSGGVWARAYMRWRRTRL